MKKAYVMSSLGSMVWAVSVAAGCSEGSGKTDETDGIGAHAGASTTGGAGASSGVGGAGSGGAGASSGGGEMPGGSGAVGVAGGGASGAAGAGEVTSSGYPERYSVGAPGVVRYRQSDATLPVPSGYTEESPSESGSKAWNLYDCDGVVNIDHKYIHGYIYVGTGCHGTINITNTIIAPPPGSENRAILVNADASAPLQLNISDTTIRPEPVPLGGVNLALTDHAVNDCETCTIHMNRVDVANSGGLCECGKDTLIEHSWLHDNYIAHLADPSAAHTGGVFPYGGSGPLEISHNRLEPGVDAYAGVEVANYWKAITAVLFTQSSGGSTLRNYDVHDNFISLGAYDFYPSNGEGMIIRNNVFGPNHWGKTAACQSCTYEDWSGNVVGDISGNPSADDVPEP
jgi:hypothetical protein